MGRVQHYFSTKDGMLRFAFHTISERVERRMAAAARELGESPSPRALLRTLLVQMLPLSEPAKAEAPVLVAFLARAVVEPDLAFQQEDNQRFRDFITEQVGGTQGDPRLEAVTLLALVDGLMVQLLVGHVDAETALATLDYHLDRIFGTT